MIAEGLLHNETWGFYPDDNPRRSMYAGDTRAGLVPFLAHAHFGDSYKWLLYMDDDTVFFPGALLRLLPDFDPDIPYFLTDHLWYQEPGDKQPKHPHPLAPRCLPCHYQTKGRTRLPGAFPAPVGCPCRPQLLCRAAPHMFNEHCDIPRAPATTFSMHGGAGAVLSVGLLREVSLEFMEACSLSLQSTGGDAFISICLWQAGFHVTDPGPSIYTAGTFSFDPGPEDRLGALRLLAAYIDGHRTGADRHWETTCDRACEAKLEAMVSLHIRSRSFAGLDDAAAFIKAITVVYETYQEILANKEARAHPAGRGGGERAAASTTAKQAAAVVQAAAGGNKGTAAAVLKEESLRAAHARQGGRKEAATVKAVGEKKKKAVGTAVAGKAAVQATTATAQTAATTASKATAAAA